ncbi:MAG: hypothetical protein KDD84_24170, partial [Caldilineaceae bacterium]|nr:hypothetical protein [Caldilineaceae bacterium]
ALDRLGIGTNSGWGFFSMYDVAIHWAFLFVAQAGSDRYLSALISNNVVLGVYKKAQKFMRIHEFSTPTYCSSPYAKCQTQDR